MSVICLTGGLASGKSTSAAYLADKGAAIIDADKLGHEAYLPGPAAFAEVVATFGDDVVGEDGQIDRRALGGKVFGNPEALKQLTDIVWPEIRRLAEERIAALQSENADALIVLEAAVAVEAGWTDIGEELWVNVVDREVAVARAAARDGLPEEDIARRLDSQLTNAERTANADVVIENNGTPDDLLATLDAEWAAFLERRG